MFKIRLTRQGRKNRPLYQLVAIDSRKSRDAKPIHRLGYYNIQKSELNLDIEKIKMLILQGAQLTPTAKALFNRAKNQAS